MHSEGREVGTVALDTAGTEAVRPWMEAANPDHPSLIDQAHLLDELLGVVNVPNGVWIDEQGMIVRPPEPAYPRRPTSFRRLDSARQDLDRKSTRLNSSHQIISYAVFCLKKKNKLMIY